MRCFVVAALALAVAGIPLLAQDYPMPPFPGKPKPGEPKPLAVRVKLQYICKQLELNKQQQEHVDGLWAVLDAESDMTSEQMRDRLAIISATYQEMKAAIDAGDQERAKELKEQLASLAPGVAAQQHFVDGLRPVLTDQQKAKLERLLRRLDNVTELSLTPVQVVRVAQQTGLNGKQKRQLEQLQHAFRREIISVDDGDAIRRTELLQKLIDDVSGFLDEPQRAEFAKALGALRPDLSAVTETGRPSQPATRPSSSRDQ